MMVLPAEIDMACAGQVAEDLASMLADGVEVAVVDMSGTTFCDTAGVQALVAAWRQAQANDTELRLVVPSPVVRRVFELLEVDRMLPVFTTLHEAMADAPADTPGRPGSGRGLANHPD